MSARRSAASLAIFCLFGIALFHTLGCGSSSPANTTSPSVPSSAAKNLYYLNQVTVNNTTTSTANIIPITATGSPTPTSYNLPSTYNSGYFAFDGSGNLYVAASTSNNSQNAVFIFAAGSTSYTTPTSTVSVPVIPNNLVVDAAGDIFVSAGSTNKTIYKYTRSGSSYTQSTIIDSNLSSIGFGLNNALSVDGNAALHILGTPVSSSTAQVVDTFAANNTSSTPTSTLTLPTTTATNSTKEALSITTDAAGDLFVVNADATSTTAATGDIAVYTAGTTGSPSSPARDILSPTLQTGFNEGIFLAAHVDSAGNVYSVLYQYNSTTNANSLILVGYNSSANGAATPTYKFTLPSGTNESAALAFSVY